MCSKSSIANATVMKEIKNKLKGPSKMASCSAGLHGLSDMLARSPDYSLSWDHRIIIIMILITNQSCINKH